MDALRRVIGYLVVAIWTALGVAALLWISTDPASAAQTTPPPYSHSWYVHVTNGDWYTWANQVDGPFDNSTCTNSLVVLDYGQPDYQNGTYGTRVFAPGSPFIADISIIAQLENYAQGWYFATTSCPRLHIVAGTNNYNEIPSGGGTPYGAGAAWADVGSAVQNYLNTKTYAWQITAWAGDDMEQPSGGEAWDCAALTRQFVDGYNGNPSVSTQLVDYGTAWVPNTCWTTSDVYYVAWGATWNIPLPEIYTQPALDSWVAVRKSYFMIFQGVMTECQDPDPLSSTYCTNPSGQFAPTLAWKALWYNLALYGLSQPSLDFATNIK